jgi:glycosyltransferase involved in cell wall biosynthesis
MSAPDEVLMLTNVVAPDKLGGLERYVRELSSALARRNVSVTILSKAMNREALAEEELEPGVTVLRHRVPRKSNPAFALIYPLTIANQVYSQLRRRGRVAVHGHYPITALPAALSRRPYIYTFHSPVYKEILAERQDSYRLPRHVQAAAVESLRRSERGVVRRACTCITLSDYSRRELTVLDDAAGAKTRLIPGGIDTTFFSPGPSRPDLWPEAETLLMTARRLTIRTGVAELVEAMPAILQCHPGVRLAIAGDGGQRDAIEATIRRLALHDKVRLLGRLNSTDLRSWYRRADLGITPTQELEGFGLSTGEALACGLPNLVTPVGASPELVAGLDPSLVTAGPTRADLAAAVSQLLDDPALLPELRRRARTVADPAWSWDTVADRYLAVYEETLGGR